MSIASKFSHSSNGSSAVAARTNDLLDGKVTGDPLRALRELAESLPKLDAVQEVLEGDASELTEVEKQQKDKTEEVIRIAVATGNASIWIAAQGLERAYKGRWWRRSHDTYEAYVNDLTGRSASYVRRLRSGAPLALETAARTGRVPNPGQVDETRKTEKTHGQSAAIMLFQVVSEVAEELGDKPTAETLRVVRQGLPPVLPDDAEQQKIEIERVTRRSLGHGVETDDEADAEDEAGAGNPASTAESQSEERADGDGDGGDDEIVEAEVVPESLVVIKDATKTLLNFNRSITRATFAAAAAEADPHDYAEAVAAFLKQATAFQKKGLHAPKVYGPAPSCGTCETVTLPGTKTHSAFWWCPQCEATQGERKPL
ncbi:hypothetical protein [Streptomyces syringium]|uniref:hypothetical protein n=1 Tax=Streptomyces syringium TaxID=76729 RepID=UPI003AB0B3F0